MEHDVYICYSEFDSYIAGEICKKLEKGYEIEQIAEILEENESTIRTIVEIAQKYAPEYDTEKILKELWECK